MDEPRAPARAESNESNEIRNEGDEGRKGGGSGRRRRGRERGICRPGSRSERAPRHSSTEKQGTLAACSSAQIGSDNLGADLLAVGEMR